MDAPVSVIIPCYRSSNVITRAVNSVATQTSKPTELIIVDDGSGDETKEVLQKLQDEYGKDWIKLVYIETNMGPSVARNTGWELATQEYIAFLDADDAWHPDKIAVQYSWMKDNPDIVLSGHSSIMAHSSNFLYNFEIPNTLEMYLISKYHILASNKLYTSCVMLKTNISNRFCNYKRYCEDYLLWMEIILGGHKAAFFNYPMTIYFKEYFGEAGLSSNLWKMECSELENYVILWKNGYTLLIEMYIFLVWSFLKYLRRLWIINIRKIKNMHLISHIINS